MEKDKSQKGKGYSNTANWLFPSNPIRKGEIHAPLYVDGKFKLGSFLGPGTNLVDRIRDGTQPVNLVDKVAMGHDLRYSLAKDKNDVRAADLKMISKLNELRATGKANLYNTLVGKIPIKAKMLLEDARIVGDKTFASYGNPDPKDVPILEETLEKLKQEGFGRSHVKKPRKYVRKKKTKKTNR